MLKQDRLRSSVLRTGSWVSYSINKEILWLKSFPWTVVLLLYWFITWEWPESLIRAELKIGVEQAINLTTLEYVKCYIKCFQWTSGKRSNHKSQLLLLSLVRKVHDNVGPLRYSKPCTLSFFFPEKMLFFKTASVMGTYLQISHWSTGSVTCRETILFC